MTRSWLRMAITHSMFLWELEGLATAPQFQDLETDTGIQLQSQHTDTDFSETQTVPLQLCLCR